MVYKRGKVYWYEFEYKGERIRQSANTTNKKAAMDIEAAHRLRLANGEAGIFAKKIAPTLQDFIVREFEPWARGKYERRDNGTWESWYRPQIKFLLAYKPLLKKRLDEITSQDVEKLIAARLNDGCAVSTANNAVRILRRLFTRAVEWGFVVGTCKVRTETGEVHRTRVVKDADLERYLLLAPTLIYRVALILAETGMRPSELYAMRWEFLNWTRGTLTVQDGKTGAARRDLRFSPRVRELLEVMYAEAGKPGAGWLFPADTAEGHITLSTVKKPHNAVFKEMAKCGQPVERFVLYNLRHTFLTKLGETGVDVHTLMRVAGHSNIKMAIHYVHPRQESMDAAMERMYGG